MIDKQHERKSAKYNQHIAHQTSDPNRTDTRQYNYYTKLSITFSVIVIVLVLANIFSGSASFSDEENRMLSQRPEPNYFNIFSGRYESDFESYINDQFPARTFYTRIKTTADVVTGKVESNNVYLCYNGYLIEKFQRPSKKSVKSTADLFKNFAKTHAGIKSYVLTVPTAASIMKSKLPLNAPDGHQDEYINNIYSLLKRSGVYTIDVRDKFKKLASKGTQLYYHSDHHWTSIGAYIAFLLTAKKMGLKVNKKKHKASIVKNDFKGMLASKSGFYMCRSDNIDVYLPDNNTPVSILTYVDKQEKTTSYYKSANLNKKDAYTVFTNGNHPLIKIRTSADNNNSLLIIKDSYANCFIPFIAPYFKDTAVIDPRYYFNDIEKLINEQKITHVLFLYNANTLSADKNLKTALGY